MVLCQNNDLISAKQEIRRRVLDARAQRETIEQQRDLLDIRAWQERQLLRNNDDLCKENEVLRSLSNDIFVSRVSGQLPTDKAGGLVPGAT
jgi:hypothetical protein